MVKIRWTPLLGNFDVRDGEVVFRGGRAKNQDGQRLHPVGNALSDQLFGGGSIRASIRFDDKVKDHAAGIVLYYQPEQQSFLVVMLGGVTLCSIQAFHQKWNLLQAVGDAEILQVGHDYELLIEVIGSSVSVTIDGAAVLTATLPSTLPVSHCGIWARGQKKITFSGFEVRRTKPTAFVVMEFAPMFDQVYEDVIKPICEELGMNAVRADEALGPGMVIADITRQIAESLFVIAEITPANSNVYYEVGYAHALRKPTILLARAGCALPFDVSPFRTLFYEDSIGGKGRFTEMLRKHLVAIQQEWFPLPKG